MRYELANTLTTYRYIHTYIHRYSGFLIVLISVGLAQARPNNYTVHVYCIGKLTLNFTGVKQGHWKYKWSMIYMYSTSYHSPHLHGAGRLPPLVWLVAP